jgi:hypothetical protein
MEKLVSTALFSLTFGGNDYINNYLMPRAKSNKEFTLPQWQSILIAQYKLQLIVSPQNPILRFRVPHHIHPRSDQIRERRALLSESLASNHGIA